ncbi:SDR family oxidoreductase [Spirosoma horti]
MDTKNKIALVTGGSRGLGKDMALKLGQKGLDVIVTYNTRAEEAQNVVAQLVRSGRKAAALQLNTGDIQHIDAFVNQLTEVLASTFDTDRLDFLINNAGIGRYAPIGEINEELFDDLLNVHFKGVLFLTQKLLPLLNEGGGIVNVSTVTARISVPGSAVYSSMKGAMDVFTRYLAKELGARGIRANTVAPGAVTTDFGGGHLRENEGLIKYVSSMTALGRPGVAEDIGGAVAFLCTDDARWVNGQRLEVSGGLFI